jgi:hypothetical protein
MLLMTEAKLYMKNQSFKTNFLKIPLKNHPHLFWRTHPPKLLIKMDQSLKNCQEEAKDQAPQEAEEL